ncbi:MAG: signal recognition particle protein [Candidatus Cloacimonadales bacterium]|jgi:signal recognition particle subunit SRP54|nr:signal recognition particle protein [Candidatus Cloacimonadota bacterium]MDD2651387.1 signal recognition particle protein [Candidatus Cloacimonadota bacterium]MDD3500911.1 signal recognition particle protein [Candidatus Cloacimonadota bacterium]MDX9976989.1 signal recognition particle protein [Candidatus Cloacimonadales bacterium]
MFNDLSERLNGIFRNLKGKGKLSESNIKDSLKEIRMALLEADVNFRIVKNFIKEIQERALGQEVMKSLEPGQQVVKIVHEQLIALMDNSDFKLDFHNNKLTKIMLVGLQGSGKTTACAKLANYFRKKKNAIPSLVACDVYRPAAIHQLEVLGKQLNVPVISDTNTKDVKKIAKQAMDWTQKNNSSLMIFDTAGRLHIDQDMMKEIKDLKDYVKPDYIFFVADAMTGQDAVNVAKEFNDLLAFDAVILTKLDGDARGGAALSIKAVTDKPVAFVGMGEKISDLEEFFPDRMASRILGMGDVLSLIEKAQDAFDEEQAEKLAKKMKKNQFTLSDFLEQLQSMKKMGPLDQIMKMIPGVNAKMMEQVNFDGKQLAHIEAIIYSMTIKERENPKIINGSRRIRIAKGSGTSVQAVNRLLKQFEQMKSMMKNMNSSKFMKNFKMPF